MTEPTMRERIEAALEALEDNNLYEAEAILKEALRVLDDQK